MPTDTARIRSIVDHDGAVILDIEHDSMLTLNATGSYVWQGLQQGKLIDEIIADLSRDTGMEWSIVDRDVREFLNELKSRRVLVNAEATHSLLSARWRRR
jgi:coenzyme PQQ synthesis protein D (PqqD)